MTETPGVARPGMDFLEELNPEQRAAVMQTEGPLLILAGAGSGKTRVISSRVAYLVGDGHAEPDQVLAVTFTNKAAAEMRERVNQLVGGAAEGMWISTFHSACVRILRRQAEVMGMTQGFTIYDSADSRALIKRIIKEMDADTFGFTPGNVSAKISKLKNELSDVENASICHVRKHPPIRAGATGHTRGASCFPPTR